MSVGAGDWGLGTERCLIVGMGATGLSVARHLLRGGVPFAVTDSRSSPPAAAQLAELVDVPCAFGAFSSPLPFSEISEAVVSPGVALDTPFIAQLRAAGIPLVGDIELFARAVQSCSFQSPATSDQRSPPVIAITGSNGKSTVTAWTRDVLVGCGVAALACGNFGSPALDALAEDADVYVLELSSFQLELTSRLPARVATVLNVCADHMDRHPSMAHYAALKARIFAQADIALINADDPIVAAMNTGAARVVRFGHEAGTQYRLAKDAPSWALRRDGGEPFAVERLAVAGHHNRLNALAVWALTASFGVDDSQIFEHLGAFSGLAHRCQVARQRRGITWIDDSKGTNLGAAAASLASLDTPIVWLVGGQSKGADFGDIGALAAERARVAIVYGQDADVIARSLEPYLPVAKRDTLGRAVACALEWAQPGDSVLLSPGCASFDEFSDYAARGRAFVQAIDEVAA